MVSMVMENFEQEDSGLVVVVVVVVKEIQMVEMTTNAASADARVFL